MNRHTRIEVVAGDDWQFDAIMLDPSGNPIDLTGAVVQWTLLDGFGYRAVAPGDYTITPGTDPGSATVKIAPAHSTKIRGGGYSDFWRVTSNNITQTLLTGIVGVLADPFTALAEPALQPITGTMATSEAADGFAAHRAKSFGTVTAFRRAS